MPRFFINKSQIEDNFITLNGEDAAHISFSLRAKTGEKIIVCDEDSIEYICKIKKFHDKKVILEIDENLKSQNEPEYKSVLFQCLPKSDKMEHIIKKCVELGIYKIYPVISQYCISRPDKKAQMKKLDRYRRIALEAAKQSGRAVVPEIGDFLNIKSAAEEMLKYENHAFLYENIYSCGNTKSMTSRDYFQNIKGDFAYIVGSEGGFSKDEAEYIINCGIVPVTLGKRILRCETAPVAVLSIYMYSTNNL